MEGITSFLSIELRFIFFPHASLLVAGCSYMETFGLKPFEWGLIANLMPEDTDEANKLIPSLVVSNSPGASGMATSGD